MDAVGEAVEFRSAHSVDLTTGSFLDRLLELEAVGNKEILLVTFNSACWI